MVRELTHRLLPFTTADGAWNMAADEVLLESAITGTASLRFYQWSEPTLSLGYFQPATKRLEAPLLADLPFVRRASGGDALVHHHELTYCLAVPAKSGKVCATMHQVIVDVLRSYSVDAHLFVPSAGDAFAGVLCFEHFAPCDVMIGDLKIVGSAQRKRKGAVMQHGGILLSQSNFTPSLPGIEELSGVVIDAEELQEKICEHWNVESGEWTASELEQIAELRERKYARDAWNQKR